MKFKQVDDALAPPPAPPRYAPKAGDAILAESTAVGNRDLWLVGDARSLGLYALNLRTFVIVAACYLTNIEPARAGLTFRTEEGK